MRFKVKMYDMQIATLYQAYNVGDTIYNIEGKPYIIKTDFIVTHPNDEGMRIIANEIFKNLRLN